MDKFSFLTVIRVSCLHLGQYNGKFSSTVSSRIFNRVLLPQKRHKIHSIFMLSSSVLGFLLFLPYGKLTVFLGLFLLTALGFPSVPAYIVHAGVSTPAVPLCQCLYLAVDFEFRAAFVWD